MQAIILAGGLGTRLRSVVSDRPKPMALVEGKPFLEYVLQGLKKSGIDDIIFAVGYKGGMVEEYFGDGSRFGIRARYAYEEELLGTAGAIKNAGKYVTDEQFFVLNGDTFYQMDFGDLSRIQQEKNLEMALVLRGVPDISRYGAARLTDGLLTAFNEKNGNTGAGTINGGVYLMKRALLDEIPEGKVSLENECIPRWMQEGRRLGGIVNDGYFIDIGVPEDYFRFQEDVRGRAPLRVSFGGGGTDVEPFCVEQGGAIIGSTINKYAYCSIIPRDDDQITVHSLDFDMTVKYNAKENYVCDGRLDLVTEALRAMDIKQGCEVYLQCDAPAGSGLGTSSTVMVSLLTAMARWKGITLDNYAMADLAYGVERIDLGISGGYQDQYAATFGGFNFIEFHGRNNVVVNPLRIRRDIINELQYNLLLCYTGNIHVSANIIKDQVSNYKKPDAFQAMCEVKALSYAMKDELLKGNLHNFGRLLDYGWESKKRMSSKITNPQIDMLYDEAKKAGALGGKLLGAGGGGFLLVYCPYNVKHQVARRLEAAGGQLMDWNFELRGAQSWICDEDRWDYRDIQVQMPDKEYTFHV